MRTFEWDEEKMLLYSRSRLLPVIGIALITSAAEARTYRWVDDEGNTVYSQQPPPAGKEAVTLPPPPPPAESPEKAKMRYQKINEKLDAISKERKETRAARQKKKKEAEERRRTCLSAQEYLEELTSRPMSTRFPDASGEYQRHTPEERAEKIEKTRKIIEKNCD